MYFHVDTARVEFSETLVGDVDDNVRGCTFTSIPHELNFRRPLLVTSCLALASLFAAGMLLQFSIARDVLSQKKSPPCSSWWLRPRRS
ncbi:MAG: hypothetical protein GY822_25715 [Deltaproteobacteria bacterium]|nr:hypothetical protein [Deltaproteobacteria bacterium]